MSSDGLIELDEECWSALSKYNLALATVFGALAIGFRTFDAGSTLLVVENGLLALWFGAVQSYAWLSR